VSLGGSKFAAHRGSSRQCRVCSMSSLVRRGHGTFQQSTCSTSLSLKHNTHNTGAYSAQASTVIYSLHARIMILNFDPPVMTFYWLFVTMSYTCVLLLCVVFLTFDCLTFVFALIIVYMLKSICNRIVCVCHLIIKDYLLTYLLRMCSSCRCLY